MRVRKQLRVGCGFNSVENAAGVLMPSKSPDRRRKEHDEIARWKSTARRFAWDGDDIQTTRTSPVVTGDRVRAHLWNFDGRHNDVDAGVFPPDVDDPDRIVVGVLHVETVQSAFDAYERWTVIEDDGRFVWVESETVEHYPSETDAS